MRNLLLLTFILFLQCILRGQNGSAIFSALSKEDGLPNGTFHTSLMDSKGFVWFGLEDRLVRWDGRHTKEFTTVKNDTTSLSCTFVKDLLEDIDGTIWVATIGGGVCQYDPLTQRFKRFSYDANDPHSISDPNIWTLFLDSKKDLWLGTFNGGLSRFNRKTKTFDRFPLAKNLKNEEEAYMKNTVRDIIEDVSNPNILWLGTNDGVVRFEKSTGATQLFTSTSPNIAGMAMYAVSMDTPNELWVGTYGAGLARFDTETFKWTFINTNNNRKDSYEKGGLKRDNISSFILDMIPIDKNELWVCSQDMGVGRFNRLTGDFQFFKYSPDIIGSVGANTANSISKDARNRLWITHGKKGASMLDLNGLTFQIQDLPVGNCTYLGEVRMTSFDFDPIQQNYYVTLNGCDGLLVLDKNKRFIKKIEATGIEGDFTLYQSVKADNQGTVWVGGMRQNNTSLWVLQPHQTKLQPFKHRHLPKKGFNVYDILIDGQDLWLATDYFGLMHIDKQKDTIISYVKSSEFPSAPSEYVHVRRIQSDGKGNIWMATQGEGVFYFNTQTKQFKQWLNLKTGFNGTVETRVNALAIDNQGLVWLASSGNGIQILDPDNVDQPIKSQFGPDEGLPSPRINNLVKDKFGNMWVTTEGGVSRYDEKNKRFITYGLRDGILNNRFYEQGVFASPDGALMIGQGGRFCVYDPQRQSNQKPTDLVFSSFKVFEQTRTFSKALNYMEEINLKHDENFFTISFSDLTFPQASGTPFAYRLEGYDDDWIFPTDARSSATYTGVPPGNYNFRVKLAGIKTDSERDGIAIKIIVAYPWWRTWWAYGAYGLVVGVVFYRVFRFNRNRHLEKTEARRLFQQELIKTVDERTEQLRTSLGEKEVLLKEIHHRVKNNLEIISSLLTLQSDNVIDNKAKAALEESQSRVQSIALIHHKLYRNNDLSTVEFKGFTNDLYKQVKSLFLKKNDEVTFSLTGEDIYIDPQTAIPLGLIFNELFTNAFKYAVEPNKNNILAMHLTKIQSDTEGVLNGKQRFKIVFRDNGKGLPAHFNIDKIQSLGMKLMKLLVKQIGARLSYYNENGTVFEIDNIYI